MTKKEKDLVKRSKSADDLTPSSPLVDQRVQHLQEQLTNLQKSLGQHDPSLLRKAREELINIRQRLQELFPEQTEVKPNELLAQLITQYKELTDQNNELRLDKLKTADYFTKYQQESQLTSQLKLQLAQVQQELTKTQQDLKSAQRIIELGLTKPLGQDHHQTSFDYGT
jgi:hypothetical protein